MLAAAYGQPPNFFDDWPVAQVERELEIYAHIRADGEQPLTSGALVDVMVAAGLLKRS